MQKLIISTALIVMLSATVVWADNVSGTAGAGWQTWNTAALNNDRNPYWDGGGTGTTDNIGYCISGTGTCGMSGAPGVIPYWGFSNGTADSNISFIPTGFGETATLKIELAGAKDLNEFGYQDSSGKHVLFTGPDNAGAVATFTAVGPYVFYLYAFGTDYYYTDSSLNLTDPNVQHFALFNGGAGTYYLGAEDTKTSDPSDWDYNDMVVKISAVPEPSTLVFIGSGLIAVFGRRRSLGARRGTREVR